MVKFIRRWLLSDTKELLGMVICVQMDFILKTKSKAVSFVKIIATNAFLPQPKFYIAFNVMSILTFQLINYLALVLKRWLELFVMILLLWICKTVSTHKESQATLSVSSVHSNCILYGIQPIKNANVKQVTMIMIRMECVKRLVEMELSLPTSAMMAIPMTTTDAVLPAS